MKFEKVLNDKKESVIQKEIIEYLKTKKCLIIRINGVSRGHIPSYYGYCNGETLKKGISDIVVLYKGNLVCFEVKTATGKLSNEQKKWKGWIEENGGVHFVVRSLEEVINVI